MTSCLLRLRVKDCFALFRFFQSDVLNKPSSQRLGSFVLNGRRSSFPRVWSSDLPLGLPPWVFPYFSDTPFLYNSAHLLAWSIFCSFFFPTPTCPVAGLDYSEFRPPRRLLSLVWSSDPLPIRRRNRRRPTSSVLVGQKGRDSGCFRGAAPFPHSVSGSRVTGLSRNGSALRPLRGRDRGGRRPSRRSHPTPREAGGVGVVKGKGGGPGTSRRRRPRTTAAPRRRGGGGGGGRRRVSKWDLRR